MIIETGHISSMNVKNITGPNAFLPVSFAVKNSYTEPTGKFVEETEFYEYIVNGEEAIKNALLWLAIGREITVMARRVQANVYKDTAGNWVASQKLRGIIDVKYHGINPNSELGKLVEETKKKYRAENPSSNVRQSNARTGSNAVPTGPTQAQFDAMKAQLDALVAANTPKQPAAKGKANNGKAVGKPANNNRNSLLDAPERDDSYPVDPFHVE